MAKLFQPKRAPLWGYAVSIVVGAGGWEFLAMGTAGRSAWDNPSYYSAFVPILIVLSGVLGFFFPERPWRWGLILVWSQAIVALATTAASNLFPSGLVVLVVLTIPCVMASYLAGFARSVAAKKRGRPI